VKENATERGGGVKTTKELSKRRTGMSLSTTCFGRTLALHVSLKTPKNFWVINDGHGDSPTNGVGAFAVSGDKTALAELVWHKGTACTTCRKFK
jgi:hypothetical protein